MVVACRRRRCASGSRGKARNIEGEMLGNRNANVPSAPSRSTARRGLDTWWNKKN